MAAVSSSFLVVLKERGAMVGSDLKNARYEETDFIDGALLEDD
jgi:hypothetical protein